MNLPNRLTVLRIFLVPVFVAFALAPGIPLHYLWAFLVFVIASLTDHHDGKIARERNLITNFGKFLDPLADKILVISALVCFVQLGLANVWCVLIIIAREFMVTSIRLIAADSGMVIAANNWGKAKTVSQMIAIIAILVFQIVFELLGGDAGAVGIGFMGASTGGISFSVDVNAFVSIAGNVLLWIATFFAVLSGVIYLWQNKGVISSTK